MKKYAAVILLLLFISCKKNTNEVLQQNSLMPTALNQVSSISNYTVPSDIGLQQKDWETDGLKATYNNLPIVGYFMKSKKDPSTTLVVFELQNKHLAVIGNETTLSNNIRRITYSGLDGREYFEFQINQFNEIAYGKSVKAIPFANLSESNVSLRSDAIEVEKPITLANFNACMNESFAHCDNNWMCRVVCGISVIACASGFAVSCVTIIHNS